MASHDEATLCPVSSTLPEPWREVAIASFALAQDSAAASAGSFARRDGWIVWQVTSKGGAQGPGQVAGVFASGRLSSCGGGSAQRIVEILSQAATPVDLLVDARSLHILQGDAFEAVSAVVTATVARIGDHVSRLAMVVPDDWTAPWWHGLLVLAARHDAWRTFATADAAWEWLAADPASVSAVRRLGDHLRHRLRDAVPMTVASEVEALLVRRPEHDLNAVAHALGVSPRSLQRTLASACTSFQDVRTQVRLALACRLLVAPGSKVECVAREVGFTSTAHFIGWFRRHRGATPSQYRHLGPRWIGS